MLRLLLATGILVLAGCGTIPPAEIPETVAAHTQVVVFDIDGTLTPHNFYVFEARPGATEAAREFVKKGYKVVYITTRIPMYQYVLANWLRENDFPVGALHVAQTAEERSDPARFKAEILDRYRKAGWQLQYAYGDSATDFDAYATAKIPSARVFALKRRFSSECTGDKTKYASCLEGWIEHLPYIHQEVMPAR